MSKSSSIVLFIFMFTLISNAQAYPIDIKDDLGYAITIERQPERIVSLTPSATEILFAVGAGGDVVGRTMYADYPPEVEQISEVGGYSNINIEKVVDLNPDLVIAETANSEDTINTLKELGLTVVVLDPRNINDIFGNILLVGKVTGYEDNARSIVQNMTEQIDAIKSSTENIPEAERPRVLYIVWHDPMYAAGKGTYPDDLITIAGGKNIVDAEDWPVVSVENIVAANPQLIICSGMGGASYTIMEAVNSNEMLDVVDAIKNGHVYAIESPSTIERSGPRIVQGLQEIYGYILNVQGEDLDSDSPVESRSEESGNDTPGFGVVFSIGAVLLCYLKS